MSALQCGDKIDIMNSWAYLSPLLTNDKVLLYKRVCVYVCCVLRRVWLFVTPRTVARHAPLSVGFPRQEYWSGLPFPTPGDLPDPKFFLKNILPIIFLLFISKFTIVYLYA